MKTGYLPLAIALAVAPVTAAASGLDGLLYDIKKAGITAEATYDTKKRLGDLSHEFATNPDGRERFIQKAFDLMMDAGAEEMCKGEETNGVRLLRVLRSNALAWKVDGHFMNAIGTFGPYRMFLDELVAEGGPCQRDAQHIIDSVEYAK